MTDKQRIEQLEQAMGVLARMMLDHQGGKPRLLKIIARYAADAQETRPQHPVETRAA
jgi:hypothetical protein